MQKAKKTRPGWRSCPMSVRSNPASSLWTETGRPRSSVRGPSSPADFSSVSWSLRRKFPNRPYSIALRKAWSVSLADRKRPADYFSFRYRLIFFDEGRRHSLRSISIRPSEDQPGLMSRLARRDGRARNLYVLSGKFCTDLDYPGCIKNSSTGTWM